MENRKRNSKRNKTSYFKKVKKGFTLTEVLIYVGLLAIFLNFVFQIYYTEEKIIKKSKSYSIKIHDIFGLKNIFLEDIRSSSKVKIFQKNSDEKIMVLTQFLRKVYYIFDRKNSEILRKVNGHITGRWSVKNVKIKKENNIVKLYFEPFINTRIFKNEGILLQAGLRNGK